MPNTATQEKFIGGLKTSGALDAGSGFDRQFGASETNDQYSARLDAWKQSKQAPAGPATPAGPAGPPSPPLAGLMKIAGIPGAPAMGAGMTPPAPGAGFEAPGLQPGMMPGSLNALRAGLGMRIPPQQSMDLASRGKAY